MLARSPLEEQLRPIGGGLEGWRGVGVNGGDGVYGVEVWRGEEWRSGGVVGGMVWV